MDVLVTGGAGFLGSHLCDLLLADGHRVLCVDNLYSGQRDNIAHLLANPSFEFIEHDVIEAFSVPEGRRIDRVCHQCGSVSIASDALLAMHSYRYGEQIYHLACPASPVFYQADPIFTTKTSVYGTLNMLELAKKHNARYTHARTYTRAIEHDNDNDNDAYRHGSLSSSLDIA